MPFERMIPTRLISNSTTSAVVPTRVNFIELFSVHFLFMRFRDEFSPFHSGPAYHRFLLSWNLRRLFRHFHRIRRISFHRWIHYVRRSPTMTSEVFCALCGGEIWQFLCSNLRYRIFPDSLMTPLFTLSCRTVHVIGNANVGVVMQSVIKSKISRFISPSS